MRRTLPLVVLVAASLACHGSGATNLPPASTPSERRAVLEMFARGYVAGKSGEIFLVAEKGNFFVSRSDAADRFMHGSPWDYDVRIPMFFYGPPLVRKGEFHGPARQQDVAPTLAALLGLPVPPTMTGRILTQALSGESERPRAVFLAVLDGLGADTFERLGPRLPTLSRLRRGGAWFPDARIDFLPTVTAAGHATISTGTDPRFHGIHANSTFDHATGKEAGPFPDMSPKNYLSLTLADHWSRATAGRAVVIAQGAASRATVALAGHGACADGGRPVVMATFDGRTGGWVTNGECFRLPDYLRDDHGEDTRRTARFPRFQVDALIEMIEQESVGQDAVADLLLVNFKTPDYVAHQYGPASAEMDEAMRALDSELGRVLSALDEAAGPGRYVVAVTADHGMPPEPQGPDEAPRYVEDVSAAVNRRFDPTGRLVLDFDDPADCQMHVSLERLAELKLPLDDVAAFLEELPFIRFAFTEDQVRAAADALPRRSGDPRG